MRTGSFIVGLTGGIGSGKTTVQTLFEEQGIVAVDADVVAREVVEPGSVGLAHIAEHFGNSILLSDGNLDRKALRSIIFENSQEKEWLEALLHPLIRKSIQAQLQAATSPYVILTSPLLLETDQHTLVNRVCVVDTNETSQIKRASSRDDAPSSQIEAILASQLSRQERLKRADDVINNHEGIAGLPLQVKRLHALYLTLCTITDNP